MPAHRVHTAYMHGIHALHEQPGPVKAYAFMVNRDARRQAPPPPPPTTHTRPYHRGDGRAS